MPTDSERHFEAFCAAAHVAFESIATASASGEQRPDYRCLGHDGSSFWAEIKEVTPNKSEAAQIRRLMDGGVSEFGCTPGARLREFISKANPQLRALTNGKFPGVLVVVAREMLLGHHTERYAVLTAMRGLDVVPVLVPKDPAMSPRFLPVRPGPRKKMTPSANRAVSAVLILRELTTVVEIFHNRHAACPLQVNALSAPHLRHFCLREDGQGWEQCSAAV